MNNGDGNGAAENASNDCDFAAENAGDDQSLYCEDFELVFDSDVSFNLGYDVEENKEDEAEPISVEDYFKSLPSGFRFCPTDVELIKFYLKRRADGEPLPPNQIHEANIYDYTPQQISVLFKPILSKDNREEWYFLTPRERKYAQGIRPNRAAGTGYWKATAADKKIYEDINGEKILIGTKKSLVFYEGKPPCGVKTDSIMHEYVLNAEPRKRKSPDDMRLDDFVLCRVRERETRSSQERGNDENLIPHSETSAAAAARQVMANDENLIPHAETSAATAARQGRVNDENLIPPAETSAAAAARQVRVNDENSVQPTETSAPQQHYRI